MRLLAKGKASNIDELDPVSSTTPLMMACEHLYDLELIRILAEEGKADVNAVNNDNEMPLGIVRKRKEKEINE